MRLGAVRLEVRLHLPDLLEMTSKEGDPLAKESVDAINVALANPVDRSAFARDVSARIPGLVVQSTAGDGQEGDERAATFIVLERFHLAIAIVTVIASSIFLLALMLMMVDERRSTVGILRLIGFRRRRILLHVFAEGVVIATGRRCLRRRALRGVSRRHQPILRVAVRHRAGIRPDHTEHRAAIGRAGRSTRCPRRSRLVLDAPASRSVLSDATMKALAFAARSLSRQPGRAALGILGIAAVGALLFDMLLLSRGLVVSFRDLLDSVGFDVRVMSTDSVPLGGPRLSHAAAIADELAALPEIADVVPIRMTDAEVSIPGGRPIAFSLMGIDPRNRRPWSLTTGQDLGPAAPGLLPALLVSKALATALKAVPGDEIAVRAVCVSDRTALPPVALPRRGVADFPFDDAKQLSAASSRASVATACGDEGGDDADMLLIASREGHGPDAAVAAIQATAARSSFGDQRTDRRAHAGDRVHAISGRSRRCSRRSRCSSGFC